MSNEVLVPRIYSGFSYFGEVKDGKRAVAVLHIAATSNLDAMKVMRESDGKGENVFITNTDHFSKHCSADIRYVTVNKGKSDEVTEEEFQRLLKNRLYPSVDQEGESEPPIWFQVHDLTSFTKAVNAVDQAMCDKLAKDSMQTFDTQHCDMPENMLKMYFDEGFTAEQAFDALGNEAKAELAAEARASL